MARLYPNKWVSREGDICNDEGVYTKNFIAWCKDLTGITNEQFAIAFASLENQCGASRIQGKESWPPNYAEFKALCKQKAAHKQFARQLPFNRADRNKKGKQETSKLKDLISGARYMPDEEADKIIEKSREDGLRELFS